MITFEINEAHDVVLVGGRKFEVEVATLDTWDFEVDGIPLRCTRLHGPKFIAGLFRAAAIAGIGYLHALNHKGEEVEVTFNRKVHPIVVQNNQYEVSAAFLEAVA
jgi:hypothetical protein